MTEQTTPTGTPAEPEAASHQSESPAPAEPQAPAAPPAAVQAPPAPVAPPVPDLPQAPPAAVQDQVSEAVEGQVPVTVEGQVSEAGAVKVKKDRRVLRAVLRWTAATVVFAAVGTAAAYGITRMERTDVPGLATQTDGRWDYPTISKPPLPSGSPGPFAEANTSGSHYADLRKLVLPAPKGAKADAALRGEDGWLTRKAFLAEYAEKTDRDTVGQLLTDYGLRHIAARGWTAADGTRTRIYLLQFDTAAVAEDLASTQLANYDSAQFAVRGVTGTERDEKFPERAAVDEITRFAYTESKPYGAEQVREAYLSAGDTVALVVQSHKGLAKAVPFQQTVILQSQLLG
ncbi:hypothetical protein [Streptomyces sp. Tue6028]|uniref:hypothetical protein n=1 Tax=Streptomyces sp. Tue6028 TaxID=2036037 RepID=UPI00211C0426|nr:hypothetical protein [Streptomyces sp. Tue6028]